MNSRKSISTILNILPYRLLLCGISEERSRSRSSFRPAKLALTDCVPRSTVPCASISAASAAAAPKGTKRLRLDGGRRAPAKLLPPKTRLEGPAPP